MKNLILALFASSLLVACTTTKDAATPKKDAYDIRPAEKAGQKAQAQTAVEWQNDNDARLAEQTKPETLAKFVASPAAADALLAQIGTAYAGDPLVLTQIAAVTQLVMCPKCPKAPARRSVWVAALKRARAATDDGYVRTFCDQQLRLCD